MKRTAQWIVASLFTGLLIVGCVAPTEPDDEDEDVTEPEVGPQADQLRITTYYSEPAHINQVGYCVWRQCPPKGTTCSGVKTNYYTVEFEPCY